MNYLSIDTQNAFMMFSTKSYILPYSLAFIGFHGLSTSHVQQPLSRDKCAKT